MNTFDAFDRCLTDMAANMAIMEELETALDSVYTATCNGRAPADHAVCRVVNKTAPNPFSNLAPDPR